MLVQVVLERGLGDAVLGRNLLKRLPAGLSLCMIDVNYSCT